jgi:Fms-interacting protein/Thoc5
MAVHDIVTDKSLLPVLQTSAVAHAECLTLLSLIEPSTLPLPSQDTIIAISKQQKLLFSLLAQLRGLNRDAILRIRETKQATAEARQEIDRLHLQLQNLYYEQRHLTGEIAACESYESVSLPQICNLPYSRHADSLLPHSHKYLSLPLIPVEEFLAHHPEHQGSTPHELMIARINHEHAEREKLEQARQELLKRKQALIAENKKRKDHLANLDQDLERFIDVGILLINSVVCYRNDDMLTETFIKAAKPIQKIFEKEY